MQINRMLALSVVGTQDIVIDFYNTTQSGVESFFGDVFKSFYLKKKMENKVFSKGNPKIENQRCLIMFLLFDFVNFSCYLLTKYWYQI